MNPMLRISRRGALNAAITAASLALLTRAAAATSVRDATGRNVEIADTSRIVSIGGAITETLYALQQDEKIVAIDSTSLYPPRAGSEKPNVGYMRALSAEGVLGLNPSLVLAAEGSGPKETMAVLQSASVPLVIVPDHYDGAGVVTKIRMVARATGAEQQGACLADAVARDLEMLTQLRARIEKPARVLFVLSFANGRPMVAGAETAADGIIKLAGGVNAVDGYRGYKQISDEAIVTARPDIVLAMQRAGAALDADTVFSQAAFSLTPAAEKRAFVSMDGLYLLGFGPRTPRAAHDLAIAFYPHLRGQKPEPAAAGCP